MLSRLAFRHVTAKPLIFSSAKNRVPACVFIIRNESTDDKPVPKYTYPPPLRELSIQERVANIDAANKLYFGPDRDMVNFPSLVRPERPPPVRFGFIPESWFQVFYEKTGVTGPYVFGVGLISFLLSKEYWVFEHQLTQFLSFWLVFYGIVRLYGAKIKKYLDDYDEGLTDRMWHKPLRTSTEKLQSAVNDTEKFIWREEAHKYLYEAKRENVDFQLEAAYRQRLAEVGQTVKKRLDYQLDIDNAKRRIHQQHMVQWIVDGVVKGITPQQEKESLVKCIQDLKALAAQQSTAAA